MPCSGLVERLLEMRSEKTIKLKSKREDTEEAKLNKLQKQSVEYGY